MLCLSLIKTHLNPIPWFSAKSKLDSFNPFAKSNTASPRGDSGRVVIYTRVSTKEQADNNQSLATQKKFCEAFASQHDKEIVAYFGGTYESANTDERKECNRMLAFVKKSKEQIGTILIYIAKQLRKARVDVVSVTQTTDTRTSSGKFQQNIQFLFSQWDNDQQREKCIAGTVEKLRRGEWPLKVPMGYDQVTLKGQQSITVNEKGKLLRKAFLLKAEQGLSNLEIIERLARQGLRLSPRRCTRSSQTPFTAG